MPLTFAKLNEENVILNISGKPEIKKHLETLGFNTGSKVTVITSLNGNLIVNIKESRVALSKELANKIII